MYCTLDDLISASSEQKLIELTDDDNLGIVGEEHTANAIDYADQFIDGYLRTQYTVPLSPAPKLIVKLSVDLALFYLYGRRFDTEIPEGQVTRYKNAERILTRIQEGKLKLGLTEETTTAADTGVYRTNKTTDSRVFSDDVLDTF